MPISKICRRSARQTLGGNLPGWLIRLSSDLIEPILAAQKHRPTNTSVQHAETEVPMHIAATDGVRMRDSSIAVGVKMVKRHHADAFVSPGNTGAVMATSLLTLGRIEGVSRPAITAVFPTSTGIPSSPIIRPLRLKS